MRFLSLVFTIVTLALGGISVFEYFYRLYNLFRSDSTTRPLNARKSWVSAQRLVGRDNLVANVSSARFLSDQFHYCVVDIGGRAHHVSGLARPKVLDQTDFDCRGTVPEEPYGENNLL
jgi:hypothetical protein